MRLSSGGDRGNLLLADMDPVDLALGPDGIGQAIQAVPNDFRFGSIATEAVYGSGSYMSDSSPKQKQHQ